MCAGPARPLVCPDARLPRQATWPRRSRTARWAAPTAALAVALLAGCATVTPGLFQVTVRDPDDTVLEQFQFQAGSQASLESAMIGMCRIYPDATIVAEQLQTHEQLKERCKRSFATVLGVS